jgi:hypothetical protein
MLDSNGLEVELTKEQQAILIVEKLANDLRKQIANEVELKFHNVNHDLAHDIAAFIRLGEPTIS